MILENGSQKEVEYLDGNDETEEFDNELEIECLEDIFEILNSPSFNDNVYLFDRKESETVNCLNCGYQGSPNYDSFTREGKTTKYFAICPICGDKKWQTLVGVVAKIRNRLNDYFFELSRT